MSDSEDERMDTELQLPMPANGHCRYSRVLLRLFPRFPDQALENEYRVYKCKGVDKAHFFASVVILCCTMFFALGWGNEINLHGTLFREAYALRLGAYLSYSLLHMFMFLLIRFGGGVRAWVNRLELISFITGLYGICVLSFDPSRVIRLLDYDKTYATELRKWFLLYNVTSPGSCGGYVIGGPQDCYFNNFEAVYLMMITGVFSVQAFYFRLGPRAYLALIFIAVPFWILIAVWLGTVNSSILSLYMNGFALLMTQLTLFHALSRTDGLMRAGFLQVRRVQQEKRDHIERLNQEKERLNWELSLTEQGPPRTCPPSVPDSSPLSDERAGAANELTVEDLACDASCSKVASAARAAGGGGVRAPQSPAVAARAVSNGSGANSEDRWRRHFISGSASNATTKTDSELADFDLDLGNTMCDETAKQAAAHTRVPQPPRSNRSVAFAIHAPKLPGRRAEPIKPGL